MGAIHFRRIELVASLSEHVGYKAGIALTRERMAELLDQEEDSLVLGNDDTMMRVRSEVYGEYLCNLLYAVGNISSPDSMPSIFGLYRKFEKDKRLLPVYVAVQKLFNCHCEESFEASTGPIDLNKFVERAKSQHGTKGECVALIIVDCVVADMHKSFLGNMRRTEWRDVADLEALFRSEKLRTPHGEFFDQRFVDFLSHNFSAIKKINWRKFEGLTCEFFHRVGFFVEIGKGRNDDSVDARIWQKGKVKNKPPLILVQCKREKEAVGKVVVKALYADIKHENAQLGLIVTSSALAPGARKVCLARSYPILEANRDTLKSWVDAMPTPYAGVFLGE
jgi:restriction system protein